MTFHLKKPLTNKSFFFPATPLGLRET